MTKVFGPILSCPEGTVLDVFIVENYLATLDSEDNLVAQTKAPTQMSVKAMATSNFRWIGKRLNRRYVTEKGEDLWLRDPNFPEMTQKEFLERMLLVENT